MSDRAYEFFLIAVGSALTALLIVATTLSVYLRHEERVNEKNNRCYSHRD
jgi:hypothetical protein